MIAAIITSFVVGMMASPNMATAHLDLCAQPSVNSEKSVWHALCDLQIQINNIPRGGYPGIENIIIKNIKDCDCKDPSLGWDPPKETFGIITDDDVKSDSFIAIMTQNSDGGDCTVFRGMLGSTTLKKNQFGVDCSDHRSQGSELKYMIVTPSP